jgi:hypothetical protein
MGAALSTHLVDLAHGLEWAAMALLIVGSILVLAAVGLGLACWPVRDRRRPPGGH